MSMSADIQPSPTRSASPGTAGEGGRATRSAVAVTTGCCVQPACRSHGALAVPVLPSAGRGTGREPLAAEQMMVLSGEQIRGMLSLPSLSPSAWLGAVSPQICSIRPYAAKQDQTPRQHKTYRPRKRVSWSPPLCHSLVAVPPRALCHHWCPHALGWAVPGLFGAGGPECRLALQ